MLRVSLRSGTGGGQLQKVLELTIHDRLGLHALFWLEIFKICLFIEIFQSLWLYYLEIERAH